MPRSQSLAPLGKCIASCSFCVGLALLAPTCQAQDTASWTKLNEAGMSAYKQGHYADAEHSWLSALKEAEKFGIRNPRRLETSLNNLAGAYESEGKYPNAESLYKRALELKE